MVVTKNKINSITLERFCQEAVDEICTFLKTKPIDITLYNLPENAPRTLLREIADKMRPHLYNKGKTADFYLFPDKTNDQQIPAEFQEHYSIDIGYFINNEIIILNRNN